MLRSAESGLELVTADYCLEEVKINLGRLTEDERQRWSRQVQPRVKPVKTQLALDRPLVFSASKDRPVIISALASDCEVLVTLDQHDFSRWLGADIYGLRIMRPAMLVAMARKARGASAG